MNTSERSRMFSKSYTTSGYVRQLLTRHVRYLYLISKAKHDFRTSLKGLAYRIPFFFLGRPSLSCWHRCSSSKPHFMSRRPGMAAVIEYCAYRCQVLPEVLAISHPSRFVVPEGIQCQQCSIPDRYVMLSAHWFRVGF